MRTCIQELWTWEESMNNGVNGGFGVWFGKVAARCALTVGSPAAFVLALATIVVWAVSGPYYHYSDTWQLVINTGTTIVTFLMVFLIQNTQNRDARALHLKLDEVIRAIRAAHNEMIDIEHLSDSELDELAKEYERLRSARASREKK
jgi:low affinity Fe/Cu permease